MIAASLEYRWNNWVPNGQQEQLIEVRGGQKIPASNGMELPLSTKSNSSNSNFQMKDLLQKTSFDRYSTCVSE